MMCLRVFLSRLRGLLDSDARVNEEIDTHIAMMADEYERRGLSPEGAFAAARREFGGAMRIREAYRDQRRLPLVESIAQDLRYAARQLRARPGFTATAILTLALGIGANTAIFQLLDAIVLRPLPVREPQDLVRLQGYLNRDAPQGFTYPLLREMNARQHAVEGIFATGSLEVREALTDGRTLTVTPSARVATGNYFRLLGTEPQLGRLFTDTDDTLTAAPVAVISDRLWRSEFAAQPGAIGHTLRINGVIVTIAGVARPEFFGERVGTHVDVWMPMSLIGRLESPSSLTASVVWLYPMARLRPGVSLVRAEAELSLLWNQLKDFGMRIKGVTEYRLELEPASQGLGTLHTQFSRSLWLLMGIVALVALIACCNLANLLLARATARTHEIGVRLALGAGRRRLVRQLLTESLALALLGGGLGLGLAAWAARRLVALAAAGETWQLSMSLDWRAAGWTLLVTFAAASIFGLVPAFAATRIGLNAALQSNRRTRSGGRSRHAAAKPFVVAQVALSMLLIAGASLLVRSFWNLTHQDFGFRPKGVLLGQLDADIAGFRDIRDADIHRAIADRLREVAGVQAVGTVVGGPLGSVSNDGAISTSDRTLPQSAGVKQILTSPGYFDAMGIPVLAGRSFTVDDRKGAAQVAVITESAARLLFGGENPLDRRFTLDEDFVPQNAVEVVGVVHDLRYASPREPFGPLVFLPTAQHFVFGPPVIVVRTAGDPMQLADPLRRVLREVAPALRIAQVTTLFSIVETAARRERLLAWLSGAFGALALVLAAVGLYGVITYTAELRTPEMGVRLALGARPSQVRVILMRDVAMMLATGLSIGTAAALAATRALESLLFGLTPHDPATLVLAAAMLAVVAVVAGYIPARRAAGLDPLTTLRRE